MKNRIERLRNQIDELIDANVRVVEEHDIGAGYSN